MVSEADYSKHWVYPTTLILSVPFFILYFIKPLNINLGPGDLILVAGAFFLVVRTRTWAYPDYLTLFGVICLLGWASVSLMWSPLPGDGLLQLLQLALIFVVTVPFTYIVAINERYRKLLWLVITTTLSVLVLASVVDIVLTQPPLPKYSFIFPQHNTWAFVLMVAVSIFSFMVLEDDLSMPKQVAFAGMSLLSAALIFVSEIITPKMCVAFILLIWLVSFTYKSGSKNIAAATISFLTISIPASAYVVLLNIDRIITEFMPRYYMYVEAIQQGIVTLGAGRGIGSSQIALSGIPNGIPRSTHNVILHFWAELGIFGAAGVCLIIIMWIRNVFVLQILNIEKVSMKELGMTVGFGAYLLLTLVQPPPVRRFWWVLFAISWATTVDQIYNN